MAGMTRTFLAVDLPASTRSALERLQHELRAELPGVRWTRPAQLHLTLAFLGDVPTDDLPKLGARVDEAVASVPRFDLQLQGVGAFPTPSRARVVWVGVVGEALAELDALQRLVAEAARQAGHPPADDRFHPHVTIGRSKGTRGPSPDLAPVARRPEAWQGGPLPVAELLTIASELTPGGPVYRTLRTSPLAPPSP